MSKIVGLAAVLTSLLQGAPRVAHADFVWPNVPDRIAKGLESTDPAERRSAAQQLMTLPPALAKPLVLKALGDEDNEVRITAAKASARLKLTGASDIVAAWLVESDPRLRLAACEVIRSSPTEKSVTALGRVLSDPSQEVRAAAALAMGRSGSADAVSLLLGHLDDTSPEVRAEVVTSLGRLGDARAVLPLVGKVQDTAVEVRRRVARALGDLHDKRALSALVRALSDASTDVRVESALALGRIGSDEATVALAQHVQPTTNATQGGPPAAESSLALRQAALRSLGRIASPRAIDLLLGALESDRPDAGRTPARDALVSVGGKATKALQTALSGSPSSRAAIGIVQALGAIGDRSATNTIVRAMQRGAVPAPTALATPAQLKADEAMPAVLELLGSASPDTRRAAIRAALAMIDPAHPDGRAVEPVQDALSDPNLEVEDRVALVELLGRTGSPRSAETLLAYATSKSPALRRASLRGLGALAQGSTAVDEKLVAALDDELGTVRMDAAIALSRVGTKELGKPLLNRLLKSAEQDRAAIGIALAGVMARSQDGELARTAAAAVSSAPTSAQDAVLEGIGRLKSSESLEELKKLAAGNPDDRRKVAEVLASQGAVAQPVLITLAGDSDPGVRAHAAWSLGAIADKSAVTALARLVTDQDVNVAGNAVAALGRLAARVGDATLAESSVCASLSDTRAYVRANALAGIRLAKGSCDLAVVGNLLATDPSERVRLAAAALLHEIAARPGAAAPNPPVPNPAPAPSPTPATPTPAAPPPPDPQAVAKRALDRCTAEEPTYRVARACDTPPQQTSTSTATAFPLTVFVVPDGASGPVPRAPFALVLPDGTLRLGLSDRRGVVFEATAPQGEVELAVPAALVLSN